jgi:predicted transcriptional regulator
MKVKQAISELIDMECKNIEIEFLDAETITSTLIGYLTKEKNSRKVSFSLIIHNKRLVQLLSHIGLDQAFDIRNP